MPRISLVPKLLVLAAAAAFALSGCSDATAPDTIGGDQTIGTVDPAAATFVLKTIDFVQPDGTAVPIQLVGSGLVTDSRNNTVLLDVAVRNLGQQPLHAPAIVWVEGFVPAGVSVLNADLVPPAVVPSDSLDFWIFYGFRYDDLLGPDGVLTAEETSAAKTWVFHDPGLASFSFRGWAEFGPVPDRPQLSGLCFVDLNRNGRPDPGEPPLQGALVTVTTPSGATLQTTPDATGRYVLPVSSPGLYRLQCGIIFGLPPLPPWTTPNPLEVLLTPGPDGNPNTFLEAHFGQAGFDPPPVPIIGFTDVPPADLHRAPWNLVSAEIARDHLKLRVGFSGCEPVHPFSLWMSGGFMESMPVRVKLVLVHELDEECDAAFEQDLVFSLAPLQERFLSLYGPGRLILSLQGLDGSLQELEWDIYPPD
jgi:hypothetical protein